MQFQGNFKMSDGVFRPPQLRQQVAQLQVRLDKTRVAPDRLLVFDQGFVRISKAGKNLREVQMPRRPLRIEFQSPAIMRNRLWRGPQGSECIRQVGMGRRVIRIVPQNSLKLVNRFEVALLAHQGIAQQDAHIVILGGQLEDGMKFFNDGRRLSRPA